MLESTLTETVPQAARCGHRHKIWIDLDNSPHVPFFAPIIEELQQRGYDLVLTSRDNAQVIELLRHHRIDSAVYGRHHARSRVLKVLLIGARSLQMAPLILQERPDLAISHGSRSQIVLSKLLGIPSIAMCDYEHATLEMMGIRPNWLMFPNVISEGASHIADPEQILKYPGIKEDVYAPRFKPVPGIREALGLSSADLLITLRPPASEAHYHNPLSDDLFQFVVNFLSEFPAVRMVLLPRNDRQEAALRQQHQELFAKGVLRMPDRLVDGMNLIWHSDLVISGGGTMNREAAALGVPVYSIFLGRLGAVDRHLAEEGRLILLKDREDVRARLRVTPRAFGTRTNETAKPALGKIIDNVVHTIEKCCKAR
jgi:predicted glycosyltransferase